MSTSDGGPTPVTGSCGEGTPALDRQESKETTYHQDEQFDKLKKEDTVWLLNKQKFFPDLAWRKVVDKLKKKTDVENCSNASPFFGDLLQEKRERKVVLPTVFGILAKRYYDEKNKDESYKETNVESIPWKIRWRKAHRMTGLWKCRLVCKKWNKGIEAIHRNETAGHYQMDDDFDSQAENKQLGSKWGIDIFNWEPRVFNFLGNFEATHYAAVREGRVVKKCPFLGRAVHVKYDRDNVEINEAYFSRLIELFEKFGDQVWYFKFSWESCPEEELVDFYLKVKRMVELMPNLKVLRINCSGDYSKEEEIALGEEIRRSPFPEGTNLKMISVDEIPGVFVNHLVQQNRQIRSLDIKAVEFNGTWAVFAEKIPNLNQLGLLLTSLEVLEGFESYPDILNLEKLRFRFDNCCEFVRWSRIFNAISSKVSSDICTDLQICMTNPVDENDDDDENKVLSVLRDSLECRLQLANIQRCKVDSCSRFCLDFLLPSKNSLREIKIEVMCEKPEWREEQVIKFLGYEDKMEYSNIAKELPRLKKLEVEVYTKDEYELCRHYSIQPNRIVQVEYVDVRKKE